MYNYKLADVVQCPNLDSSSISAWAQYSIVFENYKQREKTKKYLKSKDIPSMVYYSKPLHLQQAFANLGYSIGDFPISEKISDTILSLPMHPYLSEKDIDFISTTIMEIQK